MEDKLTKSSLLGISNHSAVCVACKPVSVHWRNLGARLGVLQPTLAVIKSNYRGCDDSERCLSAVIEKWLTRPRGEVRDSVAPTWRSLCVALFYISGPVAQAIAVEHGCGYISTAAASRPGLPQSCGRGPQCCGCVLQNCKCGRCIVDQLIRQGFNPETQTLKDDNSLCCHCKRVVVGMYKSSVAAAPIKPPIADFKLKNFSKLKSTNRVWETPPFYSHEGGYKLVLAIHPNGVYERQGKCVSIFIHLMKGEFDGNLVFPFRGTVLVQAVNQVEDKNHIEFPVHFDEENDPYGKCGARVKTLSLDNLIAGHSTDGWGLSNFLCHNLLPYSKDHNTCYLSDSDEIEFRIADVQVYSM